MDNILETYPSFDPLLDYCPLCLSKEINYFDRDYKGVVIYRCSNCKNKFMNPQYSNEHLKSLYTGYIDTHEMAEIEKNWEQAHLNSHQLHLKSIEEIVCPGKILSFGCGNGKEIQIALERGWHVHGYDIDYKTVEKLQKIYNAKFYCDDFFNLNLPSNYYDCIYLDQVLEHLKTPSEYLAEFHRLLKPGGVLFIATPNIESVASRWKSLLGFIGLKRQYGKHYDTWHHLIYFSPSALKKLLIKHFKFEVITLRNDVFISPDLPIYRNWFLQLATKVSFMWRTTFFVVARKN